MSYELLTVEQSGYLTTLTLNRPEKLNALNPQLASELHRALDEVAGRFPDVRVVVLTGAGRGFCSGADVMVHAEHLFGGAEDAADEEALADGEDLSNAALAPHIRQIPQPVIACINGVAVGAGLAIALACDVRLASEAARFGCLFIKRALVPDGGTAYTLPALVGQGVAAEMALTGRLYDASWALQVGLVNGVVPGSRLLGEGRALGEEIASNPPLAVQATKLLMHAVSRDLWGVLPLEREANVLTATSKDRKESVLAFLGKRQPEYRGR